MQINQIIVRPEAKLILIQHTDNAFRSGVTVLAVQDMKPEQVAALETILDCCWGKTPKEPEKPVPSEVEQEIVELEYRLEHLRKKLAGHAPAEAKP